MYLNAALIWDNNGGVEGHAQALQLLRIALDFLEDDVEEVRLCNASESWRMDLKCWWD